MSKFKFKKIFILKFIFTILMFFIISKTYAQEKTINKSVVKNFDIHKYLGTWYEIARYDHFFERDLVGVTANYSIRKDGKIKVINNGYEKNFYGKKTVAIGKAKTPNQKTPAKLKVSFFWFFYGEYNILELDKNYQWAIVGSKSNNYLWILSRTPKINKKLYTQLLELISKRGYDINLLLKVEQKNDK
jgi:apolipoprotein D and lipocalin family protein